MIINKENLLDVQMQANGDGTWCVIAKVKASEDTVGVLEMPNVSMDNFNLNTCCATVKCGNLFSFNAGYGVKINSTMKNYGQENLSYMEFMDFLTQENSKLRNRVKELKGEKTTLVNSYAHIIRKYKKIINSLQATIGKLINI